MTTNHFVFLNFQSFLAT